MGFTLIEIMIVVAIIGLLAAIAIPNFVHARTQSQQNACINNLRQIDGAKQNYALDNKVGVDHFYGSFTAPTTGIHGWFWVNKTQKDVMFHVTTAGFYDSAKMFAGDPKGDALPVEDAK